MHSAYSKCLSSTGTLQFASPTVTESGEVSHTYIIYFSLLLSQNGTFRQNRLFQTQFGRLGIPTPSPYFGHSPKQIVLTPFLLKSLFLGNKHAPRLSL